MAEGKRKFLMALVLVLIALTTIVQSSLDRRASQLSKALAMEQGNELMVQLPSHFIIATMAGFREVVAGVLWVRADSFFHSGEYEGIVPIVRLVTWLDPHNIDVFTTGAWHLDYNFVDDNEMSDKRYIPASISLLKEGIRNNPDTWDLYFELAWTHYNRKLNDYEKALEYMEMAVQHDGSDPNTGRRIPRPAFVDRMLAHQYEKTGQFEKAIEQWHVARKRAEKLNKLPDDTMTDDTALTICDRNLSLLYLRLAYRYGNMDYYRKGLDIMERLAARPNADIDSIKAAKGAAADYARRVATNNPPSDAGKPVDAQFNVNFEKLAPKVFRIHGSVNILNMSEYKDLAVESITGKYAEYLNAKPGQRQEWVNGARVFWRLSDLDYKYEEIEKFTWKIDKSRMIAWDSMPVYDGKFGLAEWDIVDLSVSDIFYPFNAEKYKLTVWMTPREPCMDGTLQDRIGWKGEALTDARYLDTTMLPGYKCLKWETILDKKDLL